MLIYETFCFNHLLLIIISQEMDYGTLMCWADNVVGQQKEPCIFHIIAAGKPDVPYNCTLVNQTSDGLEVDCNEGKYSHILSLI